MTRLDGNVLIVRHGESSERAYLQGAIDHISNRRPELAARIRLHWTGEPKPDLDEVRAVVFWLRDPLRERYPDYQAALEIAVEAQARGLRVANHPAALSHTVKSTQARIWQEAGIRTPSHRRFVDRADFEAVLAETRFPAVLRADDRHGQIGMRILDRGEDARALSAEAIEYPGSIADFVDVREGYRASGARHVWSELYHKKRQFVFGPVVRASHLFFSSNPLVSSNTCTLKMPEGTLGRWRRRTVRRLTDRPPHRAEQRWLGRLRRDPRRARELELFEQSLAADIEYWETGCEQPELMRAAASALGLDFAAIDYSTLADGSLVLWEANPYFLLPVARVRMLAAERRTPERVSSYYDGIGKWLSLLLDGECDDRDADATGS